MLPKFQRKDWDSFNLFKLKGSIAQSIVESILIKFKYEVYPFGYENYYRSIVDGISQKSAPVINQMRVMPDLLVYDRNNNRLNFCEVKYTKTKDDQKYWILKNALDGYFKYWPSTILVVYRANNPMILAKNIEEIDKEKLNVVESKNYGENYELNLDTFHPFYKYFPNIDKNEYLDYFNKARVIIKEFE